MEKGIWRKLKKMEKANSREERNQNADVMVWGVLWKQMISCPRKKKNA